MSDDEKISVDDLIDTIPLDKKTNEIAQKIIEEDNLKQVQDLTHLFNLNQAKKNVIRVLKLNSLLDKVSDQMIERFEQRPGTFTNDELIKYMQVTQQAIDRANQSLNLVDETPPIQINQQVNNINIVDGLDRDSKNRVAEAIKKILKRSENLDKEIIVEEENINTEIEETEQSTVYNSNNLLKGEDEDVE